MTMIKKTEAGKRLGLAALIFALGGAALLAGCSKTSHDQTANKPEATLAELNSALDSWTMMKGALPPNVSALTNFPALRNKRLPAAPPGKKLAIDSATRQVVFIEE